MSKLDRVTNFAVLATCTLVVITLLADYFPNYVHWAKSDRTRVGKKVEISGVDWSKSSRTLVIALSPQCHFCVESVAFYRSLSETVRAKGVRVLILAAEPKYLCKDFVVSNKIAADEIVSSPLPDVGIMGTPTLLLVNSKGVVQKRWQGKLSETAEAEVLSFTSQQT